MMINSGARLRQHGVNCHLTNLASLLFPVRLTDVPLRRSLAGKRLTHALFATRVGTRRPMFSAPDEGHTPKTGGFLDTSGRNA